MAWKFFQTERACRCDDFWLIFVEMGAILAIYRPFEIHRELRNKLIEKSTTKSLDALSSLSSLSSWDSRRRPAGRPGGATWRVPVDPRGFRLARSGCLAASIWCAGALAGSIWLRLARSGALAGSIQACRSRTPPLARFGYPTTAPSTPLAKKIRFAYRWSRFDAACFVRSATMLHASILTAAPAIKKCD